MLAALLCAGDYANTYIHVAGRYAVVKWVKDGVHVDSRSHVFELAAITKSWKGVHLAGY